MLISMLDAGAHLLKMTASCCRGTHRECSEAARVGQSPSCCPRLAVELLAWHHSLQGGNKSPVEILKEME